jgi:cation transport protein ChaC
MDCKDLLGIACPVGCQARQISELMANREGRIMLDKKLMDSGAYFESFRDVPKEMIWSKERIETSLQETMRSRPEEGDIWLFAYGSLMWNSLLDLLETRPATLEGYHRSYCLKTIAGRGNVRLPGRMLSIEPGGETVGLALRIDPENFEEELRLVWFREMPTGAYRPTWLRLKLQNGEEVPAIVFVAVPTHPFYESDASVDKVAPIVSAAAGPLGTSAEYLFKLEQTLAKYGMTDAYVDALAHRVKRIGQVPDDPANAMQGS